MRRWILSVMAMGVMLPLAWSAEKDTPAAAATRKKLQTKISVEYKDVSLKEITDDIKQKVNDATGMDLSIYLDGPGGVSGNSTLSYSAKDKTVAEILDGLLKPSDLGYVVVSKEYKTYKGRYDGWLLIVKALNSANNQAAIPGKCQPLGVGEGRLDGGEGSGRSRSGHRGHLQGQLGPGHAGPPQAPAMNDARNVWRSPRVSYATVRS